MPGRCSLTSTRVVSKTPLPLFETDSWRLAESPQLVNREPDCLPASCRFAPTDLVSPRRQRVRHVAEVSGVVNPKGDSSGVNVNGRVDRRRVADVVPNDFRRGLIPNLGPGRSAETEGVTPVSVVVGHADPTPLAETRPPSVDPVLLLIDESSERRERPSEFENDGQHDES